MTDRHSLLKRQLKRHFPTADIPDALRPLLEDIEKAYRQFDDDREMLERSLDLSSQELLQANAALRSAHRELEQRVAERTAALAEANVDLRREIAERLSAESERNRLEDQLRHAQKMEAIGRLAGGIAHDFNNLLTAVQGYSELLLLALEGSPLRADVEEIHRAAERASMLTRQLLAFSRRQLLSPETFDLNDRVLDMSRMMRRLIGEHITIELSLTRDLCPVRADVAQLEQSILNLALNARDAMPDGGPLLIETTNRELDEDEAQTLGLLPGAYVQLRVCDGGSGISPDVQARIFEPFFTTKPQGKGTGLGLAMVYGFVHQTGGGITVDSELGRGSRFALLLPRAMDESIESAPRITAEAKPLAHGGGTVLIVEDERALRRLAATVLNQAGYRTFEAIDGQQALDIFAERASEIAMVVTDVVMPRMGGRELAARLRRQRPELPLIYVTGYAEEGDALRASAPGAAVLLKPFPPEALLRAVSTALHENTR